MRLSGSLSVGQPVLLDALAVGLEQRLGAAQLANLLLGPLDHAVTFARMGRQHLAGAGYLEALFRARFGLQLGHLALPYGQQTASHRPGSPGPAQNGGVHEAQIAPTAALSRAAKAGFIEEQTGENNSRR